MARDNASVDDAVLAKPEDLRTVLPVPHSQEACAGAATAFVMRRIAYRAGAYAPGIQEFLFHDLATRGSGRSIDTVSGWLRNNGSSLHQMGYRISGRPVLGEKTDAILAWVKEGKGHRGAVLATDYRRMHPAEDLELEHAVGVTVDRVEPSSPEDLVMIDPWPGTKNGARDRGVIPAHLDAAHRQRKYAAIILYWAGWS